MRVRIIFRGLTLFTFQKGSTEHAKDGENMGQLTAWLVSDPKMRGMPAHEHVARMGTIGRESYAGKGRTQLKREVPDELNLSLMGHQLTQGVTVAGSFLDYVACLGALRRDKPKGTQEAFITKKIVIPSGTIRAREFISWDWHGNTPAMLAFMDTSFVGFGANEVVVDIGDDSDPTGQDQKKFFAMQYGQTRKRLWSYTKGPELVDDIEPNTVEVAFTNVAARRSRSVFWGLHMMTLFDAAGYVPKRAYDNAAQFAAFERFALEYDREEWEADRRMMGIGQPFPFLAHPEDEKFQPIQDVREPFIMQKVPPHPAGQGTPPSGGYGGGYGGGKDGMSGMKDGMSGMDDMGDMGGMVPNDPVNVTICPMGRE